MCVVLFYQSRIVKPMRRNSTATILTIITQLMIMAILAATGYAEEGVWVKTNLSAKFINSVETTPWGILASEYDSRVWMDPPPFNGVYVSKDLGVTWEQSGLYKRGVTALSYSEKNIYASTYYWQEDMVGFFKSADKGQTWQHFGPNFSASYVEASGANVYLGGFSHGFWVSNDYGNTWKQGIGAGWFGPKVPYIKAQGDIVYVFTDEGSYKSTDSGLTLVEIPEFNGLKITGIEIHDNIVFAADQSLYGGIYKSTDYGETWQKTEVWGDIPAGTIKYFDNVLYASKKLGPTAYSIFRSFDFGLSWEDTGLSINNGTTHITELIWLYSKPSKLFTLILRSGIYYYDIPATPLDTIPFLKIPWTTTNQNEFIDKITSYFDHKYPLLGYSYHTEPEDAKNKTYNYLGIEEKEPKLYYSSHDGYDYALPYGTAILAPADGEAEYYYCDSCGHTIKVDHKNGYQSIYMHFQKTGLILDTLGIKKDVKQGDQLGLVGMTGNTSGPHLHFVIKKDKNNNGDFSDDTPDGKVDPYSWQTSKVKDPWENYTWTDTLGEHSGTKSNYLWTMLPIETVKYLNKNGGTITLDNKKIIFNSENVDSNITVSMQPYSTPQLAPIQGTLQYVTNSSFLTEAYDHFKGKITNFISPVNLIVDIASVNLNNIILESLKIYYWNESNEKWEPLPTMVDLITKQLIAETTHFSKFAAFGEKVDSNPPITHVLIEGTQINGWYKEFPKITLTGNDADGLGIAKTFYSLTNGFDWEAYSEPLILNTDTIVNFMYKSIDNGENMEETQEMLIRINTQQQWRKTIKVTNTHFNTNALDFTHSK